MKNLLFISTHPFPPDMGSKQHAYFFLKAFCEIYNVYCIFFIPPHQKDAPNAHAEIMELGVKAYEVCYYNKKPKHKNRWLGHIKGILAFPSSYMKKATHEQGQRAINLFIDRHGIDIVHFEHFWYTKYAFGIRPDIKKAIVYHDLHHSVFLQLVAQEKKYLRKILNVITGLKFYIYEHLLEQQAALKIFLNPAEMPSLSRKAVHLPHIANSDIVFHPVRATDSFNILFLGTYNHAPNRRSVEFIIEHILPKLVKACNNFKIHIIGPDTERFNQLLESSPYRERIVIHGFIKDINRAFENMDIALFPILDGGGIKTKVLDTLAAGVPVVTTPNGVYGLYHLPEDCIGVGNTADELVHEMVKLMKSDALRSERSETGKTFIEKEHTFEALSEKLQQAYSGLTQKENCAVNSQ